MMKRRRWIPVVVNGVTWKFLKSDNLEHRNEYYEKCKRTHQPYLVVKPHSTKHNVLIDFYPSCYDLRPEAVEKLKETVKDYVVRSAEAHPRLLFSSSVGPTMVSFDVAKEFLINALQDVSKVALDSRNWELNDGCKAFKEYLFEVIVETGGVFDTIDRKTIGKLAKEKLGLDWGVVEILLTELVREGKLGEVIPGDHHSFYVREPVNLKEVLQKRGLIEYLDLMDFMKTRLGLNIPDDVKVIHWFEARERYKVRNTVMAIADVQNNIVSFFSLNPGDFVHELLHIAGGDEIEAYDITPIIIFLWKNKDDSRLPEKIDIRSILKLPKEALEEIAKNHGFKGGIKDYFRIMGVLPYIYDLDYNLLPGYDEQDEAFVFVMEVSADLRNPLNREILFDIVKLLGGEE